MALGMSERRTHLTWSIFSEQASSLYMRFLIASLSQGRHVPLCLDRKGDEQLAVLLVSFSLPAQSLHGVGLKYPCKITCSITCFFVWKQVCPVSSKGVNFGFSDGIPHQPFFCNFFF